LKHSVLPSEQFNRPHPIGEPPTAYQDQLPKRFIDKVEVESGTGCWLWLASLAPGGYGRIANGGRGAGWSVAHRFAWSRLRGMIPEGLDLDHLCRTPRCANPFHCEVVTRSENIRRGRASNAAGLCRRGLHPWVSENMLVEPGNVKRCKACRQEAEKLRGKIRGKGALRRRSEPTAHRTIRTPVTTCI
jgi:hypothetical protein